MAAGAAGQGLHRAAATQWTAGVGENGSPFSLTVRSFLNAFIQYNADTHQVSSNIRFDLTHHPLSDLYLVYNDRRDTTSGQLLERAFTIKLTNLFNF